jgi:hypothetical protein
MPIIFDELGLIKIPTLSCWEDKNANWSDAEKMEVKYVQDSVENFFNDMMTLVNNEYGVFKDLIHKELKEFNTELLYEYSIQKDSPYNRFIIQSSGTTFVSSSFDTNQAYKYLNKKT